MLTQTKLLPSLTQGIKDGYRIEPSSVDTPPNRTRTHRITAARSLAIRTTLQAGVKYVPMSPQCHDECMTGCQRFGGELYSGWGDCWERCNIGFGMVP